MSQEDDRKREYPRPVKIQEIPEAWREKDFTQERLEKAPLRAIKIKGDQLRAAMRTGKQLDWSDIHERYIDLWQEARLCIWRAKHKAAGVRTWDPHLEKQVLSFIPNEKLVQGAIEVTRGVLDSIAKLRRDMGHEGSGIPRWAIERIERALRNHPEAMRELLKELAAEQEKEAEKVD